MPTVEVGGGFVLKHTEGFYVPRFTMAAHRVYNRWGIYATYEQRNNVLFADDFNQDGTYQRHIIGPTFFISDKLYVLGGISPFGPYGIQGPFGKVRKEIGIAAVLDRYTLHVGYSNWVGTTVGVGYFLNKVTKKVDTSFISPLASPVSSADIIIDANDPAFEQSNTKPPIVDLVSTSQVSQKNPVNPEEVIVPSVETKTEDQSTPGSAEPAEPITLSVEVKTEDSSARNSNSYAKAEPNGLLLSQNEFDFIDVLYFSVNKTAPTKASSERYANLLKYVADNAGGRTIVTVGHADTSGSLIKNKELSLRRSNKVAQDLILNYSIPREQIEILSEGSLRPDGLSREQQRRVEIYFKKEQ